LLVFLTPTAPICTELSPNVLPTSVPVVTGVPGPRGRARPADRSGGL